MTFDERAELKARIDEKVRAKELKKGGARGRTAAHYSGRTTFLKPKKK